MTTEKTNGQSGTLKDMVYSYILQKIQRGELKANQKVNENEISQSLGVSRTPVREALIRLSGDGILENIPHRGFTIKPVDSVQATELYEVVGVLDGLSARLACPNMDEDVIKEMEFYTLSMDLAIKVENFQMYYKQQEYFHKLYMDRCGNQLLVDELLTLKRKFIKREYELGFGDIDAKKEELFVTNSHHKKMVELFREGDGAALERLLIEEHWDPKKAPWESFTGK